jgi:hypothetical protein
MAESIALFDEKYGANDFLSTPVLRLLPVPHGAVPTPQLYGKQYMATDYKL